MTAQTEDLIERLEAAELGSRELDAEVAALIQGDGFKAVGEHVCGKGAFFSPERYTTSLDAALALAERVLGVGAEWSVSRTNAGGHTAAILAGQRAGSGQSDTPALALCIAILRARSALTGSGEA